MLIINRQDIRRTAYAARRTRGDTFTYADLFGIGGIEILACGIIKPADRGILPEHSVGTQKQGNIPVLRNEHMLKQSYAHKVEGTFEHAGSVDILT